MILRIETTYFVISKQSQLSIMNFCYIEWENMQWYKR